MEDSCEDSSDLENDNEEAARDYLDSNTESDTSSTEEGEEVLGNNGFRDTHKHRRSYHIKAPLCTNNKPSTSGYFISKVKAVAQPQPPATAVSVGRVLLLPKPTTTVKSQSGMFLPIVNQLAIRPQACNAFILRPTVHPFTSTSTIGSIQSTSNNMLPVCNDTPDRTQSIFQSTGTAYPSCSSGVLQPEDIQQEPAAAAGMYLLNNPASTRRSADSTPGFVSNASKTTVNQPDYIAANVYKKEERNSKANQKCYSDIRPSISNLSPRSKANDNKVENINATRIVHTRADSSVTISSDKIEPGMTEMKQSKGISQTMCEPDFPTSTQSMRPVTSNNLFSRTENEIPGAEKQTDFSVNGDNRKKRTPPKKKRNRKPKLPFSPSGQDISEVNGDLRERPPKFKLSKKRKTVEDSIDKQYFGALHRTFAKRAKVANVDFSPDSHGETSDGRNGKFQLHLQNSDYRLKQNKLLNTSVISTAPPESLNAHHLLKKIDPNDPERKKSLAVFSTKNWLKGNKYVPSYKVSIPESLGPIQKKQLNSEDVEKHDALDTTVTQKEKILTPPESQSLTDEKTPSKLSPDKAKRSDSLLNESALTDTQSGTYNNTTKETKVEGNHLDKNKTIKKFSPCVGLTSQNALPTNLPSVVLQRISGITPTETVNVSQLFQQTTAAATKENRTAIKYMPVVADAKLLDEESKKSEIKSADNAHLNTKIKGNLSVKVVDDVIDINSQKPLPETCVKDAHQDFKESIRSKSTSRKSNCVTKCVEPNNNKTPNSKPQGEEGILHKLLFGDNHSTDTHRQCLKNHNDGSREQANICEFSRLDSQTVKGSDINSKNKESPSPGLKYTQPIPVFYNNNGRLFPGPMPITPETYRYLLSKGSVSNSILPTPNAVQPWRDSGNKDDRVNKKNLNENTFIVVSTASSVTDPTGILTPVSKDKVIVSKTNSFQNKCKTVAAMLKERRNEQKDKQNDLAVHGKVETQSPVSMFLRTETSSFSGVTNCYKHTRSEMQLNTTTGNGETKKSLSSSSDARAGPSSENIQCTPAGLVNDHLYSSNPGNQKSLKSPSSFPLVSFSDTEHQYSRQSSPLVFPRRLPSEILKSSPSSSENNVTKGVTKSPCVPLKIVLPSPKKQGNGNSPSTMRLPITVQKVQESSVPFPSTVSYPGNSGTTETAKRDSVCHSSIPDQANQSFAVRIGDKMYIIRPAVSAEQAKPNIPEVPQQVNTTAVEKPAIKPVQKVVKTPKNFKNSRKRKSLANHDQPFKARQPKSHQKDMKKKVKKLLKKNKTPFEELIQSLGLEHKKEAKRKIRRKPTHKISYSNTPSPVPSVHDSANSNFPVKDEPVTSDMHYTSDTERISSQPQQTRLKTNTKALKVISKKASILQIFKVANKGSKFYMHTAKINFTTGNNTNYHRWYQHSDYQCTLHLRNMDTIYEIDVESLRSGFYLVSEMDKNILDRKLGDTASVAAVLSLYPPDINILPEESLSIAVGRISDFDESEQPIPAKNEDDNMTKNIDSIIRSILKLETFKDVEHIEDERYGSVKDVCMSPKCHSGRFYTPDLFDYFSSDKDLDRKGFALANKSASYNNLTIPQRIDNLAQMPVSEVSVSSKAHELKMKQNELYQECSTLRDKIQTNKGSLFANDIARGLESPDVNGTYMSQDDETVTEFDSATSDSQSIEVDSMTSDSQSITDFNQQIKKGRGRKKKKQIQDLESNNDSTYCDIDQRIEYKADKNLNCSVGKKRGRKPRGVEKTYSVHENMHGLRRSTRNGSVRF